MQPIVEIISSPPVNDIPLTGMNLAATTASETEPFALKLADNSILCLHAKTGQYIQLLFSDTGGTVFTTYTIDPGYPMFGLSACELTGGDIGLNYFVNHSGNWELKRRIVTRAGVTVSEATIASWANSTVTSHTWVITVSANSYLLVYAKANTLYKRTSSDFVTWSSETSLGLAGFTNTISNPSLVNLNTGEIWCWFDYVNTVGSGSLVIRNLYYTKSSDSGATWSAAVKFTNYTDYSITVSHPAAVQKTANNMHLLYTKTTTLLSYNTYAGVVELSYDPATKYLNIRHNSSGGYRIVIWDTVTWTKVKEYGSSSIPALYTSDATDYGKSLGQNLLAHVDKQGRWVDVIDVAANTITHYIFKASSGYPVNVTWSGTAHNASQYGGNFYSCVMDELNKRLYICQLSTPYTWYFDIGYLDLTESGPNYTFKVIASGAFGNYPYYYANMILAVQPEVDLVIVAPTGNATRYDSQINIYSLSTGALVNSYSQSSSGYPRRGPRYGIFYYDDCIYFGFEYTSAEVDRRGLCKINLLTDAISYHRPTWASVDDYQIIDIVAGQPGELLIATDLNGYEGVSRYNIAADSWELYSQSSVPGYNVSGTNTKTVCYDAVDDFIFSGFSNGTNYAYMFPGSGTLIGSYYKTAAYSGGTWTWTDQGKLVKLNNEYDPVAAVDGNNSNAMFIFWQTKGGDIKWGKDGSSVNLERYLRADIEICIKRSINGDPHSLTFACSDGHLFDIHNNSSLLRGVLAKGRRLVVRWGETITGVDTWTAAGTFYVAEGRVSYERGKYSDIAVTALDMRSIWQNNHIVASDYYNNYPEEIIADLAEKYAGLAPGAISLPVFANRILLDHQWLDTTLEQVLTQVCDRFSYFLKINADNTLSAGKISDSNSIDHTYSDTATIISFEPDDKFSDYTNRVTVAGQEKSFIEVQYAEERVGQLNGTVGWWGFKNDFHIAYSQDETRTCVNPRLVVLETATSIAFELAGDISESISYEDPDEKYCIVSVEAPDLTPLLITALAGLVSSYYIGDISATPGSMTARVGTRMTAVFCWMALMVLASTGSYQYEIWAVPKGRIRRSVQGSANDTTLQEEMGVVVEKRLEDPLCYSTGDCTFVATNELMVARLQRHRVKLRKIARIGEEEGDTIQIKHPYTGQTLNLFITDLNRKLKKSVTSDGDGYFLDEIEGWVI